MYSSVSKRTLIFSNIRQPYVSVKTVREVNSTVWVSPHRNRVNFACYKNTDVEETHKLFANIQKINICKYVCLYIIN